ncbi:N-acetylmuramoyl-L-alanine amidase [Chachezhania antarctica]|uniref:N-acetylmuramoyl-L-alanine amidase n=1 Tax=Chachezhania antarctica TaxID=2340860 RepID=UPI000EB2D42A|nr:N-acetylmuramoyl-L-alanine amidase [Chachezhania antarctica]
MDLRWHPSPNFTVRPEGERPELVVIHFTAMESCAAALERLCDPVAEVSSHYLIGHDGTVWHMVEEEMRAWHAGVSTWAGRARVNHRSIGIELDNRGTHPFAEPQMAVLEQLLADILQRWGIPPEGVVGHSDIAPERKQDPGPRFDWQRLARQGLSVWPQAVGQGDPYAFRADLRRIGYPDDAPDAVLQAFRDRFRPGATGPVDATDAAIARDLAERFGVDRDTASA